MLHKLVYWQPGTRHKSGSITAHWLIFPSIIAHVLLWFSFRCLHKLRTRTSYFLHISVLSLLSACVCVMVFLLFFCQSCFCWWRLLWARARPFSYFLSFFQRSRASLLCERVSEFALPLHEVLQYFYTIFARYIHALTSRIFMICMLSYMCMEKLK